VYLTKITQPSCEVHVRIGKLALSCSLATAAGLLLSTSAHPAGTINLRPDQLNTASWAFATRDCSAFPGILYTLDGWHFRLPDATGLRFTSVTLIFGPGRLVVGPITSTNPKRPSLGSGWTGYLTSDGLNLRHAYVKVPAGLTLVEGSAQVEPGSANGYFEIADVCARPTPAPAPNAPYP
jgi:hypothetical protein